MYQPPHFRETDLDTQHALIRENPLGLLISSGSDGPVANSIPFYLNAGLSPKGTLQAHVAKANPQLRDIAGGAPVLVVFQGVNSYVTPSWYETKQETGKVVPTWNYAIVQARGPARVIEDAAWLWTQIEALTRSQEGQRAAPWAVDDAPADFIASQIKGIIGIEIEIAEIDGKWKVSQNRPEADRKGVVRGLEDSNGAADTAEMAELVRRYGKLD
ncbi:FMN-binding negative transcriptional regulator [Neorhizobium sp. P12A]|uniref:FMN-binding negative transcriptional regulator n=1 Tax=Neorhizobium sp. P12A TaxID=2268027 RepID=UPI0011EBBB03|nr:FMN-binding negative transcriptional regulator [Neorhizobium sp. P12A]KAA0699032.1 FMN-binding negative transcriptional regulator [Neorhizobium sp. P12A]